MSTTNALSGITLNRDQDKTLLGVIKDIKDGKPLVRYSGWAGCVDKDTEFFDGKTWRCIDQYENGDMVLQYHEDGRGSLCDPIEYHVYDSDNLWEFETKYGINQCLSDEHNVYYMTKDKGGSLQHKPFMDIKKIHEDGKGFSGNFITTFKYDGGGIDLSDEDIKVMCAVICDGTFSNNTNRCTFNLKKERKKIELRKILNDANIDFIESESSKLSGYTKFHANVPRREKEFGDFWYGCNNDQLRVICDNVLKWDGCTLRNKRSFSSCVKSTVDFVQFAFSSCGERARVSVYDRRGEYQRKSVEYNVTVSSSKPLLTLGRERSDRSGAKTEIKKYTPIDGKKYCFTTETGMLILRRKGCIFITGNTGKTVLSSFIVGELQDKKFSVAVGAFTGKAAKVIGSKILAAGINPAYIGTLHGLLYIPLLDDDGNIKGWRKRPFADMAYDIIFVDESSMVTETLIKDLQSYGIQIIMCGDDFQLPPIGSNVNYAENCEYRLTNIIRQAADSGIIRAASDLRLRGYVDENGYGDDVIVYDISDKHLLTRFMPEVDDQKMILCSYNNTRNAFNARIRRKQGFNGETAEPGERVICLKNNKDVGMMNGETGIVKEFVEKESDEVSIFKMLIDGEDTPSNYRVFTHGFTDKNQKKYEDWTFIRQYKDSIKGLPLFMNFANVLSIWKSQGSQWDEVMMIDERCSFLSDHDDRRRRYTGMTRAAKKLTILMD